MNNTVKTKNEPSKNSNPGKTDKSLPPQTALNGVGQIREILLGEYIVSWNERLTEIENQVKELIQQTQDRLVEMEKQVNSQIESSETRLEGMQKRVTDLIAQAESRVNGIEENFAKLDKEIKEELETNLMDLEQENGDLREMVESFRSEFEKKLATIDSSKLDRESIGDVFIQWGQKVKKE